jgi:tRNA (cmo5U34)-methyltransferase
MENQNKSKQNIKCDKLFEEQFQQVKSFAFDQQVTDVFADMIKRSVPGYESILKSIAMFCMQYAQQDSNIYDLGCSLGAVAMTAAMATEDINCHIIGSDTSQPMINKCREIIINKGLDKKIEIINQDIIQQTIENASVVVSNFTLQFIPQSERNEIVKNIYNGINKGGIFILSEKFKANKSDDDFLIQHYHAYKKLNGYSNKEIQRKREALQNVLIPDSLNEIENRLKTTGFTKVIKWFQCFNFASFIAIKE